jgi:NAD(P)-dependent dehydrogenase (short-subunit alcohol dehydrogenase family)
MKLSSKVIILTGASQGIGRAAAYKFVEAGSKVVLVARSADLLNEVVADLGERNAVAIPADIRQRDTSNLIVTTALDRFGHVDILVNNAGVGVYDMCEDVTAEDLQAVIETNLLGPIYLTQACIPAMRASGGGLVINVSSIAGKRGVPNMAPYSASKAALERLTESWRMELGPDNIRFSLLVLGTAQTNFKQNALGSRQQKPSPMKRMPPEQVAEFMVRIAEREPRDTYVRLLDRVFVFVSTRFPGLLDRVLGGYYIKSS